MQQIDQKARFFEIANLPPPNPSNSHSKTEETDIRQQVIQCGDILKTIAFAEKPLVLKAPPVDPHAARVVIALETRTHYVKSLYTLPRGMKTEAVRYSFTDYDQLRSLKYLEHGHRSFFGEDSLVEGSERLERYLLWPTGVLSPGAMRQWGRHSVAFVGKRHFDDPHLIEKIFQHVDFH